MTIVEAVKSYIEKCPYLNDLTNLVRVNYLEGIEDSFSIEEVPNEDGTIRVRNIDGSTEREFNFVLACMFDYSKELETNIENSAFFENFQEWIENNNDEGIYPTLGKGCIPFDLQISTTGYLFFISEKQDKARYQIQLKLLYEKEN